MRDSNLTHTDASLPAAGEIEKIGPGKPLKQKDKREQDPLFKIQNFLQKKQSK